MKVNYVLMYGIPYVRYKEFETFEDISKFLVHKSYVNYSIFKKLEDKEEIEMIYRDNDIHYLENFVKEQDKEIERLNNIINKGIEAINVYQNEKTLSVRYQDLNRIRGILRGNEFDLKLFEEYLKELKGEDKE